MAKLRPTFRFDRTFTVQDYPPDQEVWGYGAQTPTAGALVDETVAWLREQRGKRFFAWLFNFDQHNWRELDKDYVHTIARRHNVADNGDLDWRYRVVARGIDEEFKRLLGHLDRLGLSDDTIVVFVSDHGEALGRDGFWVHSVFLWEPLIRVPLVLRIPGLSPRSIDNPVSLADLAPTLARYLDPQPTMTGYQGEDLIGYLVPNRAPRRHPLLLRAASKDVIVRVGLVEPEGRYKLVLSLEAALPELYDLSLPDPDVVSVAEQHPELTLRMLSALARSPVFPRTVEDFDGMRQASPKVAH